MGGWVKGKELVNIQNHRNSKGNSFIRFYEYTNYIRLIKIGLASYFTLKIEF